MASSGESLTEGDACKPRLGPGCAEAGAVLQAAGEARNDRVCSARSGRYACEAHRGFGLVVPGLLNESRFPEGSCPSAWLSSSSSRVLTASSIVMFAAALESPG